MNENDVEVLQQEKKILIKADDKVKSLEIGLENSEVKVYRNPINLRKGILVNLNRCSCNLHVNVKKGFFNKQEINYQVYVNQLENKYSIRLKMLGIRYTNIQKLLIQKQKTICDTLEKLYRMYPYARKFINVIWIDNLGETTNGKHKIIYTVNGLYSEIVISKRLTSFTSSDEILEYTLMHEFAHALNAVLAFGFLNLKYGDMNYNNLFQLQSTTTKIADKICNECLKLEKMNKIDIKENISVYAAKDSKECIAEAVARTIWNKQKNSLQNRVAKKILYYLNSENIKKLKTHI